MENVLCPTDNAMVLGCLERQDIFLWRIPVEDEVLYSLYS